MTVNLPTTAKADLDGAWLAPAATLGVQALRGARR